MDTKAVIVRRLEVVGAVLAHFTPWPDDLVLMTPPGIGATLGLGWALALQDLVPADVPLLIDVDDRPGDALAALRMGARRVVCLVADTRAAQLAGLFANAGGGLYPHRPPAYDPDSMMVGERDLKRLLAAVEAWYESEP